MKILFVGVLDVDYSTNCSMKRELENLGHTVVDFNYRTITDRCNCGCVSNIPLEKWIDKLASLLRSSRLPFHLPWYYHRNKRNEMNKLLLEEVREGGFDLVLLSKTDTVNYYLLPEINKCSSTWYFFMDPMDQARRINAAAYAKRATWSSSTFSDVTEHFKSAGADAHWITQGVDTDVFVSRETAKVYDVVFAGAKTPKRLRYVEVLRNAGIDVICFGEGWENGPVYQEELADIYRKSRIVLNFCRPGSGFSIRIFQVMGTGAFLLTEYCNDLEAFFEPGRHLDWFKSDAELVDKTNYYLAEESERENIAAQGSNYVHGNFSWKSTMEKILSVVSSS